MNVNYISPFSLIHTAHVSKNCISLSTTVYTMHATIVLLLLISLDQYAMALPIPAASAAPKPPILGTWGSSVNPFKAGRLGDRVFGNPPPPSPPVPCTPAPAAAAEPAPAPETSQSKVTSNDNKSQKQKNAGKKENASYADIQRVKASNGVALFNGVPVDLSTGRPLNKRGNGTLMDKLGLGFLDRDDIDDTCIRDNLALANIGAGLAAPRENEEHKVGGAERKITEVMEGRLWPDSASVTTINGVPVIAPDVVSMDEYIDEDLLEEKLMKRGDARKKLGLGMFEVPGPRRKASSEPLAQTGDISAIRGSDAGETDSCVSVLESVNEEENEGDEEDEKEKVVKTKKPLPGTTGGKSFVVYNGQPVIVDDLPLTPRSKAVKRPRPAFRRPSNGNTLEKRGAGRRVQNLNPFSDNPLTGTILENADSGGEIEELVKIVSGDNYVLYNGQPVGLQKVW
jgi:hypothetical protein